MSAKETPLIEYGHIQENASSETGDRVLWTNSVVGGCVSMWVSGEEKVVSGLHLSITGTATALINRTSSNNGSTLHWAIHCCSHLAH